MKFLSWVWRYYMPKSLWHCMFFPETQSVILAVHRNFLIMVNILGHLANNRPMTMPRPFLVWCAKNFIQQVGQTKCQTNLNEFMSWIFVLFGFLFLELASICFMPRRSTKLWLIDWSAQKLQFAADELVSWLFWKTSVWLFMVYLICRKDLGNWWRHCKLHKCCGYV